SRRNTHNGKNVAEPMVQCDCRSRNIGYPDREQTIQYAAEARGDLRPAHKILTVIEPKLEQENRHQIPGVHKAKNSHWGGQVRCHHHLETALGMTQMEKQ